MTGPPKELFPYVLDFCRSICPESTPFYIAVTAEVKDRPVECVWNVRRRIDSDGGEAVLGWKIWEWYGVMIESEFHMLWRMSDGRLMDVTPNVIPAERVLFLPDPSLTYTEAQVNNVRRPLIDDKRVVEFIALADEKFRIHNAGDRARQYEIHLTPAEARRLGEIEERSIALQLELSQTVPGRNDLCRCGSGKKYKRCCERN